MRFPTPAQGSLSQGLGRPAPSTLTTLQASRDPRVPFDGPLTLRVRRDLAPPLPRHPSAPLGAPALLPSPLPEPTKPHLPPKHLRPSGESPAHFLPQPDPSLHLLGTPCLIDLANHISFQRAYPFTGGPRGALPGLVLAPIPSSSLQALLISHLAPSIMTEPLNIREKSHPPVSLKHSMLSQPSPCPTHPQCPKRLSPPLTALGTPCPVTGSQSQRFPPWVSPSLPLSSAQLSSRYSSPCPASSWWPTTSNGPLLAAPHPNHDLLFTSSSTPRVPDPHFPPSHQDP